MGTPREFFDSKATRRGPVRWVIDAVSGAGAISGATDAPESVQLTTEPATQVTTPAPLHEGPHAGGSAEGSAALHQGLQAGSQTTPPETSHASSHAEPNASTHPRLHRLTTTRIGDRTRVVNGKAEWSQEDFGLAFLQWFDETYSDDWGTWVWFPDIRKHYFPRFKAATGARYLQLGSLIRGLGDVTHTRPMQYVDATGRRRSTTEYWMGPFS